MDVQVGRIPCEPCPKPLTYADYFKLVNQPMDSDGRGRNRSHRI